MMKNTSFCHLHVHSQYSILESSLSISTIVDRSKEFGMNHVAITDNGNLYGAIDFYKACKGSGINPIIGCEIAIADSLEQKNKNDAPYHIVLLVKNMEGYKNLCILSSIAFTKGFYYIPRIDFSVLKDHSKGLICLSGHTKGFIGKYLLKKEEDRCFELLKKYQALFGDDFYLELQRHHSSREDLEFDGTAQELWLYQQYESYIRSQQLIEQYMLDAALTQKISLVATNDCHYAIREDWKAHEISLNIQSGEPCFIRKENPHTGEFFSEKNPKRTTFASHEFYFKSPKTMGDLFHDIPEAVINTEKIAERCNLSLQFNEKHYPVYTIEGPLSREENVKQFLISMCQEAIPHRYTEAHLSKVQEQHPHENPIAVVTNRLNYELDIITSKGLTDYFLLVWDFIHWAKKKNIPVGPGRGSVVGSVVAYLIGITEIEPLRFNLFFERFINPGRLSYPDIDVDLCMDRRSEVISYISEKYGKEKVAQIITFGTMKAKMSVRDVGRALNIPLSKVNNLAKLIPDDLNITIEEALEKEPDLKTLCQNDEEAATIIQAAKVLQGSIRNTGIHAAGIIICADTLFEHIPICTSKESELFSTQYSMKPAEMVGMLKIDFLGLKTLTVLKLCEEDIIARSAKPFSWCSLPLDDQKTFDLINRGRTLGVFQIEEGGMQDLVQKLRIDRFEEIVALLSLYRPGPMEMIPTYIARKWGHETVEYDHPLMEPILKETYGIMVYQEQIMQIASQLAGYTLSEGDVLRKAMGKKDAKEMKNQRTKFIEGAIAKDISEEVATSIFDKMEKFAEYGFNKSHSAAYGYLTYATAYCKAHYPASWLAALMTGDTDDIEKVARIMHEAQEMGIACLPPDINESGKSFTATEKGIRFALSAIKGVGNAAVETILEERQKQPFANLYDLLYRTDPKKLGKKTLELFIDAGALDQFGWTRDELLVTLENIFDDVQRIKKEHAFGIMTLFDKDPHETPERFLRPISPKKILSIEDRLFKEKQLLGLFLTGHPLSSYKSVIHELSCVSIAQAKQFPDGTVFRLSFLVETCAIKIASKTQKKFAIISISDHSLDTTEIPLWPDLYEENQQIIFENNLLWGVFAKEKKDTESVIACKWIGPLKTINPADKEKSYVAYEKAKSSASYKKSTPKKKPSPPDTAPIKKSSTTIHLDVASLRASHILYIKNLFPSSGPDCVHLSLKKNGVEKYLISLPPTTLSPTIKAQLSAIPSIQNITIS